MGKIENDYQLKISRKRVEGLKRALRATKKIDNLDICGMCEDSTCFMIEKIEREIEEYLALKMKTSDQKKSITMTAN